MPVLGQPRPLVLLGLLCLCACSPQTAVVITAPDGPAVLTLFRDDFSDGYAANWAATSSDGPVGDVFDGANPAVALDSMDTEFSRLRANLDGAKYSQVDITASMRTRIDVAPAPSRGVRLAVRQASSTQNIFYAVGAVIEGDGTFGRVGIFKKVFDGVDNYTICELASGRLAAPVPMNIWHSIKLRIEGSSTVSLVASFDDVEAVSYVDDCLSPVTSTAGIVVPNGGCLASQTGIGIHAERGVQALVDDVVVTAP